jgi:hypothetical protein
MATQHDTESPSFQQQIEMTKPRPADVEEQLIKRAVLRLNVHILGFVLGFIGALVIFAATNWLVLKGGEVVGPHLGLLDQFFIGYSVTFVGSLVGAAYGFVSGYFIGVLVGWIYNAVVNLKTPDGTQ